MSEADGMEDAVDGAMRTGLMVASRIGEQLARMREQEQRTIAAAEEQRARELQERFDAQRAAARAQLAPVGREDWWDKATPEMIERVHETATAWRAYDPEAARAAEKISEQVQSRYGIDVNNTGADEASVSAAVARALQARLEAESEWAKASAARTDEIVAGAAIAGANRQDRVDRSEPAWDAAERRQQLAESLEDKGDRESVNSRLLADKHQGTPATAAVAQKSLLAKTSKMAKPGDNRRILQRGGLER
ncbi:colicin import membrane protein [Arthrobacter sp. ok909]|uniref:hypothetical protein n=1 Tax=Arthrobacter sp. ok909 TaxID=1761746 RepID=UPI0008861375|nr:hypothetical protein [Arthrobacter sp. ok909]SDP65141.1 colicin import membrane protein [Arthrobacter sp. ok909]